MKKVFNIAAFDTRNRLVFAFSSTRRGVVTDMWKRLKFAFIDRATNMQLRELRSNGETVLIANQAKGFTTPKEVPIHGKT